MSTKRLVMIVEDEASICNLISTLLISNDYAVVTAESGHSALTLIASHNPDLILLDLGLPDMDGMEVLKTIRTWSAAPVGRRRKRWKHWMPAREIISSSLSVRTN